MVVAVYTGNDTKFGMNKRAPPIKWAKIDKSVNKYVMYIFAAQLICAAVFGIIGFIINNNVNEKYWYLPSPQSEVGSAFIIYPLRFFLLTSTMIPISFKFIIDMSKHYLSMTVEWDKSMMHFDYPTSISTSTSTNAAVAASITADSHNNYTSMQERTKM